jgi:hypothetical protein
MKMRLGWKDLRIPFITGTGAGRLNGNQDFNGIFGLWSIDIAFFVAYTWRCWETIARWFIDGAQHGPICGAISRAFD